MIYTRDTTLEIPEGRTSVKEVNWSEPIAL